MSGKPDLIVAIDYGMTCTGVAYANLTRSEVVHYIQKWPGRAHANENKVPTVIVYGKQDGRISSWGFLSENRIEQNSPDRDYCEWFKTFLDPGVLHEAQLKDPQNSATQDEVDRWTEDYMRMLCQHIQVRLQGDLQKPWSLANIEFVFSVPTTWALHPTVEKFKTLLKRAGFGSSPSHALVIGLTEAEAAAVHVSVEASVMFNDNEVLLACDAGGGTTDLSIMRVSGMERGIPELKQLHEVQGRNIGSAQIDSAFRELVDARLRQANQHIPLGIEIEDAAWEMSKATQYQDAKCCYGSPDDVNFTVAVPGLPLEYLNVPFGISNGSMQFTLADLQALFDKQINRLFDLIDSQLQSFRNRSPSDRIAHLVLSGGLGNSAYVQQKLREKYSSNSRGWGNEQMQVHVAPEPQLAVCKGMAIDRVRKLGVRGKAVLGWRCCRASYGTMCRVLYRPNDPLHRGAALYSDPLNGKQYVNEVVDWFIKKGEPLDVDTTINHLFARKVKPGDPTRAFVTNVVVSHVEKHLLPYRRNNDVQVLCQVKSDLSGADAKKFKRKNRHWWQFRDPYLRIDYSIRLLIGPADITFELWFDNQKLSKDQPIKVEWSQGASIPELPATGPGTESERLWKSKT